MQLIILGHIIGDFYIQTDKMVEYKRKSIKYMFIHCLIYAVLMAIIIFLLSNNILYTLFITGFIMVTHFLIDLIKIYLNKKYQKYEYAIFLQDQALHIIILLCIYYIFHFQLHNGLYSVFGNLDLDKAFVTIIAVLVCWKPAAIFVSMVFKAILEITELVDENPSNIMSEIESISDANVFGKVKTVDKENVKIGSWIGILEREIILILGLLGQYGAIGFVLTAKSLARFKQLENKSFAEKYLVGTLLSALIAILCIVICSIKYK